MDLIFFSAERNDYEQRLLASLRSLLPDTNVLVCRTARDLSVSLLRPLYDVLAAVMIIDEEEDLTALLDLEDVLFGVRIILVLDQSTDGLIEKGCRLRPRYIAMRDEDVDSVGAVLRKMAKPMLSPSMACG